MFISTQEQTTVGLVQHISLSNLYVVGLSVCFHDTSQMATLHGYHFKVTILQRPIEQTLLAPTIVEAFYRV